MCTVGSRMDVMNLVCERSPDGTTSYVLYVAQNLTTFHLFVRILSHFYVGLTFLMRPDVIHQTPPLRSSSPSFPRHLHHHHSLAHILFIVFFSSHYTPIPLSPRVYILYII